jgi:hypothetical protein
VTLLDADNVIQTTSLLAGTGTITANISAGLPRLLKIVINEGAAGDNDGWSLEGGFAAAPLGFQWLKDTRILLGANDSTYTVPVARYMDAGDYSVIVSDDVGAVQSIEVNLLVTAPALRLGAATNAPGYIQAFWNAPDHVLQATTRLDATLTPDSWENL